MPSAAVVGSIVTTPSSQLWSPSGRDLVYVASQNWQVWVSVPSVRQVEGVVTSQSP